ncbi:LCP family protein [Streptomyces sp. 4N509B]|uniref:LCP family protein n=1 Tax=Streptomyces sp. 4N509B TaxID=3457413 RepID=UPI003FD2DD35
MASQSPADRERDRGRGGGHGDGRGRGRGHGRGRLLRVVAIVALATLLLTGVGGVLAAGALYLRLDGNIADVDIDAALGTDRPEDSPHDSLDILVLGSDSRAGRSGGVHGGGEPARSDTAMIVHLNADRSAATVVSIPRDTLLPRPDCRRADGTTAPAASRAMFNDAYRVGGPACAVRTVEAATGVRMDHYVEIDFKGFTELIDTLGGVEVTTTKPIDDDHSQLRLPAGTHTLDGQQALALVRTRQAVGDGSDLGRIRLQHQFLRALADQVGGLGLLTDPGRLFGLADAATSAVTTDTGLASVTALAGLARDLRDIGGDDLQMITLPVTYDAVDANRVVPLDGQCDQVWKALLRDERVPASATRGSAAAADAPASRASPIAPR